MILSANWNYPTAIKFGAGRIAELADACALAGVKTPLLITDKGLASLPPAQTALEILDAAGLGRAMFCNVDPNPDETNLAAGVAAYQEGRHDGVIALGGGSALDIGKLVALMAGQKISVWDLEDGGERWTMGDTAAVAPVIAVPTTAGTGSEVGRAGLLTNTQTWRKKVIFHPKMLPVAVICDPELTVGMPPAITAGTGMDAFAHCLEAYCSPHYHPMSHGIALEGMRLVGDNLLRAYAAAGDMRARAEMMSAAMMGAVAFQKGLGAIHALSHPIGALYQTHHGTTNAVVMRPVLNFNRAAIECKIEKAAEYLAIGGGFDGFCEYVGGLCAALHLPKNLTDMGIVADNLDEMVTMALEDPSVGGNPITMHRENTRRLLESCF